MKVKTILISSITISLIALFFIFSTHTDSQPQKPYYEQYKTDYRIFSPPIPEQIDFCGESAPLNVFYAHEQFESEILINTFRHSNTLLYLKRAHRWFPVIEKILAEEGIPDDFKYLAVIESGLDQLVSSAGAAGFWQFMGQTGKGYGLEISEEIDERYHIEKSTRAACKYLKDAYKVFGNWTLAAASYNMGMGGVSRQLANQQVQNFYDLSLNTETARYVYRLLAIKAIFIEPSKYGFQLREIDLYPLLETYSVDVDSSSINWVDFAIQNGINYKTLKTLNPWIRKTSLNNPKRKIYQVKMPDKSLFDYPSMKAKLSEEFGVFGDKK
jgi:hypothetical protein